MKDFMEIWISKAYYIKRKRKFKSKNANKFMWDKYFDGR